MPPSRSSWSCSVFSITCLAACSSDSPATPIDAPASIDAPSTPDACTAAAAITPVDCVSGACTAIDITGDPIPAKGFRGYADPSIRKDPAVDRIWMGYSFVRPVLVDDGSGGSVATTQVESHIAHSDDAAATWTFDSVAFPNTPIPSGGNVTGYFNSETIGLAAESATSWFASRLAYATEVSPDPGILLSTFMVRISHAASPAALGASVEQVLALTSSLPGSFGAAYDLNALSGLACTYWNDPGLFYKDGTLYLTAECVGQGTIHVFGAPANDDVTKLVWTDRGALTTAADAMELGDQELDQADLELAPDGTLQLLVTPSHISAGDTLGTHAGCRALVVDALDPPALRRDCGKLVVTAAVTASDLTSTGSCGYDPAAATTAGIVLARRPQGGAPGTLVRSRVP